jgi:hypothetical protein
MQLPLPLLVAIRGHHGHTTKSLVLVERSRYAPANRRSAAAPGIPSRRGNGSGVCVRPRPDPGACAHRRLRSASPSGALNLIGRVVEHPIQRRITRNPDLAEQASHRRVQAEDQHGDRPTGGIYGRYWMMKSRYPLRPPCRCGNRWLRRRSLFPAQQRRACVYPAAPCFLASSSSLLRLRSVNVINSATSSHRLASGPPLLSIGGVAPAGPPNWPPPPPPLTDARQNAEFMAY